MNCIVTGRNRSGSWQIRGEQLGAALGATVELKTTKAKGFDLAIVVKRPPLDLVARFRKARVPLIWDIVDAWPQPEGNSWGRDTCMEWLRGEFKQIQPAAIVAATKRMAEDCAEFGIPVLALPHHARPGQKMNPIREHVIALGYEGGDRYLGHWHTWLTDECMSRGWEFIMNPASLADLDIVVAFRHFNGYATHHWKSNVKLANAQGSGTPCILNRESGYLENAAGGEVWADDLPGLHSAFDALAPMRARQEKSAQLLAGAPSLVDIAKRYKEWLDQLKF